MGCMKLCCAMASTAVVCLGWSWFGLYGVMLRPGQQGLGMLGNGQVWVVKSSQAGLRSARVIRG